MKTLAGRSIVSWLLLFLFIPACALPYVVVLKSGKTVQGSVLRETEDLILLKDSRGVCLNLNKADVDLNRTAIENRNQEQAPPPAGGKKTGRVVTREQLEKLREKYDLGTKSFGESTLLNLEAMTTEPEPQSDTGFDAQVLRSKVPVIVDFWAPWCGPCRKMAPTVQAVAAEFEGRATLYKVNIDERPDLAKRFGIGAIPALLFFKDGEVVDSMVGVAPRDALTEKLQALL